MCDSEHPSASALRQHLQVHHFLGRRVECSCGASYGDPNDVKGDPCCQRLDPNHAVSAMNLIENVVSMIVSHSQANRIDQVNERLEYAASKFVGDSFSGSLDDDVEDIIKLYEDEKASLSNGYEEANVISDSPKTSVETTIPDKGTKEQNEEMYRCPKYERKQWYVSPAEIAHQAKLMAQHSKDSSGASSTTSGVSSQPSSQRSPPQQQYSSSNIFDASPTRPTVPSSTQSSYSIDLLSSDPFANPVKNGSSHSSSSVAQSQPQQQGFANFANFDANFGAAPSIRPVDSSSLIPKSATVPAALAPQAPPLLPAQPTFDSQQQWAAAPAKSSSASNDADKYSALAALDEIFHSSHSNGSSGVAGVPPLGGSPNMGWSLNSSLGNGPAPGHQSSSSFGFPQQNAFPSASTVPKSQSSIGSFGGHASFGGGLPPNNQFAAASNPFFSPAAAPSGGRPAQQANPFFAGQPPAANPFAPQPTMNGAAWGQPPVVNPLMGQQATTMSGVPTQANANWNPFWG
uniref:C2H2-type domain-containing protein n=2 Tax=Plectus sambesii TaxID=2011161 RepID=A0A914UMS6_9BILA